MTQEKLFASGTGEWTATPDGNRRRVLLHRPELMLVEFAFEKGGIGALHSHQHVQTSYVAEGEFEVTIAGNTQRLVAGGAYIVPPNAIHGVKALTAGRLIDSFTPQRDDFL